MSFCYESHSPCRYETYVSDSIRVFVLFFFLKSDKKSVTSCNIPNPIPLYGVGDIYSFEDYYQRLNETSVSGCMIAREALIKPWLFTEIQEQRTWDISANERFDMLKRYTNYGLEHWGSDQAGVDKTRRFLLEWISFLYRYIPVGVLERLPHRLNERPPYFFARNDLGN
jgi:tRNA-dihydrouridine synthase 3